jgi:hypothetical protein
VRALPNGSCPTSSCSSSGLRRSSSEGLFTCSSYSAAASVRLQLAAGVHRRRIAPTAALHIPVHLRVQSSGSGSGRQSLASVRSSSAVVIV